MKRLLKSGCSGIEAEKYPASKLVVARMCADVLRCGVNIAEAALKLVTFKESRSPCCVEKQVYGLRGRLRGPGCRKTSDGALTERREPTSRRFAPYLIDCLEEKGSA